MQTAIEVSTQKYMRYLRQNIVLKDPENVENFVLNTTK